MSTGAAWPFKVSRDTPTDRAANVKPPCYAAEQPALQRVKSKTRVIRAGNKKPRPTIQELSASVGDAAL